MCERFSSLAEDVTVFRLADAGGAFLPAGSVLPLPAWFEPSSADKEEGKKRGRPAGLSVWDIARTTVTQAQALANKPNSRGFGLSVSRCREIGQGNSRPLELVRDPLNHLAPAPGWDGHALIEGLERPAGSSKAAHKKLLGELVEACEPV